MALAPINPTQITPPRVNLIDERSGAISREWYRFFLSLLTATQTNQDVIELSPDTAALLASYDAMLADLAQTTETQPDCCASGQAVLTSDIQGLSLTPTAAAISALAVTQSDIQSLALAPPGNNGSVTSVDASGGATGLTFSGGPITTSGTLTLGGTLAITNGGTGAITATAARTNLGASTLGSNVFTITNPSAVTFPRFNADNTVSALDAATFRTAIGAGTGSGSVTSVSGTGTVNGITLTGTVTSSGSLTLGGTLSGVSLTTQVSGTLPIANGGTNGTATPTAGGVTYGTGTAYAVNSAGTSGQVLTSAGAGAPTWTTPTTGTVTSVTGTAPVVSSGGSTPAISMAAATASVNGYLTSTDWTTFNNKGSGSVTSVSGTGTVNGITLTGTVTSSGSLTLGGTLSGVSLTTQVSGTLPVANGGTGVTTSTGTVAVVLSNTPTLVTPILGVASATSIATGLGLVGTPAYTFTGDLNTGMWSPAADTVAFSTAGAERSRVTSAGDVGIGTTVPVAKLHVVGKIIGVADGTYSSVGAYGFRFSTSTNADRVLWGGYDNALNAGFIQATELDIAHTGLLLNPNGGNVGIGVTAPAYKLELSTDSAAKPTSALWTIASDSRIKTETGEYTKGLDAVCALRPITYHYNGSAGFVDDGKENISIIAQEAMQHFPECVGTFEALLNEGDEEKTKLYNWNGHALTFALVNAVKELKAANDALAARVAQLEGK